MIRPTFLVLALVLPTMAQANDFRCERFSECGENIANSTFKANRSIKSRNSLSGVVPPLARKARQIVRTCGSRIISTVRRTRVRGSGRWSLHRYGHAVDISGNPRCIYRMLRGWPGGVSVDYSRIRPRHVHVSYSPNGREWGTRFTHYRGGRKRSRLYAKRW